MLLILKLIGRLLLLNMSLVLIGGFLLGGVALSAGKVTIGVVSGPLPRYKEAHKAFLNAMEKEGYAGKIGVILQTPSADPVSKANAVKKLIAQDVDVIVAYGATSASLTAKETNSIPIVFAHVYDPVGAGLASSMESSGRNITGVSSKVPFSTLIKTLKEISQIRNLGVLYSVSDKDSLTQLEEIKKARESYGYQVKEYNIQRSEDVYGAMKGMIGKVDSLYIGSSAVIEPLIGSILPTANSNKISTITQVSGLADKGVLLSIVPNAAEQGEAAAKKVINILKGTKPARIPIGIPSRVDLVINLRTAETLGYKVPIDVVTRATSVIK